MRNFQDLSIWQRSHLLTLKIYSVTKKFPKEEQFGLTLQIRKSAVSTPSNIAEGCGRGSEPQLVQFLNIAQGSSFELETQIYIAIRQHFGDAENYWLNRTEMSEGTISALNKADEATRKKIKDELLANCNSMLTNGKLIMHYSSLIISAEK